MGNKNDGKLSTALISILVLYVPYFINSKNYSKWG